MLSILLDELLDIDNIHLEKNVQRMYPVELQHKKGNASDTIAAFLDLAYNDTEYMMLPRRSR